MKHENKQLKDIQLDKKKLGNILSPLQDCICWTQESMKANSLKRVNSLYMLEPLFDRYFPFANDNRQKKERKNASLGKLLYNVKRNMNTNNTWRPELAIPLHRKTSLASVKNNFWRISGNQRNLKARCSESIYKENISNIWYIGKQLCWRTVRTTKKFSRRTCTVKLLTVSCHIKVRHSFLETENESEL